MDLAIFDGFRGNPFDRNCKCIAKSKIKGTLLLSYPDPPANWEWCIDLKQGDLVQYKITNASNRSDTNYVGHLINRFTKTQVPDERVLDRSRKKFGGMGLECIKRRDKLIVQKGRGSTEYTAFRALELVTLYPDLLATNEVLAKEQLPVL